MNHDEHRCPRHFCQEPCRYCEEEAADWAAESAADRDREDRAIEDLDVSQIHQWPYLE